MPTPQPTTTPLAQNATKTAEELARLEAWYGQLSPEERTLLDELAELNRPDTVGAKAAR